MKKDAGGFAVGTGDTDHLHRIGRMPEKVGTEHGIGRMGILYQNLPGKPQIPVHHHGCRSLFQSLTGKVVAVKALPLLADIDPAGLQLTGIGCKSCDFAFRGITLPGDPLQQFCKKHDRPSRSLLRI